ncbi:hypothetical protein POSPLADRAFT_1151380 [Postia placenta MAD-698-R-SB12]|uniref:Uncharacterized protein n=1 Tax=Postia placenta MAD-698-R-SB12 TaxID=670580 RepID=A0A1X6MS34_9APHY|nr:hypothetical protein POSPLADRAFT_1151380 [Postia placenta MAD-698-R-SB12]OSX59036.1 hypothetical protein POSPLADRAFT_1151380 [Postia placenta MAD-698-R-SB12]
MGVRYNAEKKKIGNYFSTPIYSFRCKCHLCDGWFEIQTDPKNTRYIVTSGARQKDEEWDPEENGGFAIHSEIFPDTDPNEAPVDPLAALEKSTDAQNYMNQVQVPRLEALQNVSDHYGSDPYSLSRIVRKRFREEKKVEKAKQESDERLKNSYGLPEVLALTEETEDTRADARERWQLERQALRSREDAKRRKLDQEIVIKPRSSLTSSAVPLRARTGARQTASDPVSSLRAKILGNTARRSDPVSRRLKPPDASSSIFRR